jgi:hypothetical protein
MVSRPGPNEEHRMGEMVANEADTCRKYVLPKLYAAGWTESRAQSIRVLI